MTSKWHEVELFSSKNPDFRHFCARNLLNDTKNGKNIQFFIYFICQAWPSHTVGRVLPNCVIYCSSNDWLCEFVARSPCPVLRCTHITFKRLLRRIVSCWIFYGSVCPFEIKKTIKAGSPLVYYRWIAHLHFNRQFCLYYTISSLPWSWVVLVLFWTNISKINLFSLSLWMVTRFPPFAWQICFACFQVLFSENFL